MLRSLSALVWLLPATALAVPLTYPHQGRLLDSTGQPIDGEHHVTVTLYDSEGPRWSDTFEQISIEQGYYSVLLGTGVALDAAVLAGDDLRVGITLDQGSELVPRLPLATIPYAAMADTSTHLDGGTVNASEIRVNDSVVVDSSGQITPSALGLPAGHSAPRVYRAQHSSGAKSCGASLPSFSFEAEASEAFTLWFAWSGRPSGADGHTYINAYLNGDYVGAWGEWSHSTWRRDITGMINLTAPTSGTQTLTFRLDCGNGTGGFSDSASEWPEGGLSYTVLVGG